MTTTYETVPTVPRVLVMRGWPVGFCPTHYDTGVRCTAWCLNARLELAAIQADFERYWRDTGLLDPPVVKRP